MVGKLGRLNNPPDVWALTNMPVRAASGVFGSDVCTWSRLLTLPEVTWINHLWKSCKKLRVHCIISMATLRTAFSLHTTGPLLGKVERSAQISPAGTWYIHFVDWFWRQRDSKWNENCQTYIWSVWYLFYFSIDDGPYYLNGQDECMYLLRFLP